MVVAVGLFIARRPRESILEPAFAPPVPSRDTLSVAPQEAAKAAQQFATAPSVAGRAAQNAPAAAPRPARPAAPSASGAGAAGRTVDALPVEKRLLADADAARRTDAVTPAAEPAPSPAAATESVGERVSAGAATMASSAAKAANELSAQRAAPRPSAAVAEAPSSLRERAAVGAPVAGALEAERGTACYREPPATAADTAILYRAIPMSDSTAVADPSADLKRGFEVARGEAPALPVRGDTLFLGVMNGRLRYALRVACPQP
jgi:hypothetical protein